MVILVGIWFYYVVPLVIKISLRNVPCMWTGDPECRHNNYCNFRLKCHQSGSFSLTLHSCAWLNFMRVDLVKILAISLLLKSVIFPFLFFSCNKVCEVFIDYYMPLCVPFLCIIFASGSAHFAGETEITVL
jgi:hypothetical protein